MNVQRDFLLLVSLAAAAATPAGQTAAQEAIGGVTQSAAPILDFSGIWAHPSLNALELPLSGPGPVRNRSRRPSEPQAGAGNGAQLVGDYTNPILQPWAAEVVKKFGEISLAGKGYPTPRNQCWPEGMPFVVSNFGMQMLQQPDKITILYPFDHQFRQVRMNQPRIPTAANFWKKLPENRASAWVSNFVQTNTSGAGGCHAALLTPVCPPSPFAVFAASQWPVSVHDR